MFSLWYHIYNFTFQSLYLQYKVYDIFTAICIYTIDNVGSRKNVWGSTRGLHVTFFFWPCGLAMGCHYYDKFLMVLLMVFYCATKWCLIVFSVLTFFSCVSHMCLFCLIYVCENNELFNAYLDLRLFSFFFRCSFCVILSN